MKRGIIMCLLALCVFSAVAYSLPSGRVGVSPGAGTGDALVWSQFPAFSWSSVEGAVGYRVEIFKAMDGVLTHEEIAEKCELVMRVDIPAPALSWSPSGNETLQTGESYVWYVRGFAADGEGQWSTGNRFRIDASLALSGMEEAIRDRVREYVWTDTEIREAIREIKEESAKQATVETFAVRSGENPEGGSLKGTEGPTNTFYGLDAGRISTGTYNTFIGGLAGENTTGNSNTFLGSLSGRSNATGHSNTFLGREAGRWNTTGNSNILLGNYAGYSNTVGNHNFFAGPYAGYSNTDGGFNIFLGENAGRGNTAGNCNTSLGYSAGYSNATGGGNTFIGYHAGYNETGSNRLYIHNSESSSPLIYGEFDNRVLKINGSLNIADVSSPSDLSLKKNIQPLDGALRKITNLKGVSFNWKTDEYPDKGLRTDKQIGLIAQDVEKVLPELVRTDKDGKKSLAYDKLTAVLVEAIKAQQAELASQRSEIEELKELVREMASKKL